MANVEGYLINADIIQSEYNVGIRPCIFAHSTIIRKNMENAQYSKLPTRIGSCTFLSCKSPPESTPECHVCWWYVHFLFLKSYPPIIQHANDFPITICIFVWDVPAMFDDRWCWSSIPESWFNIYHNLQLTDLYHFNQLSSDILGPFLLFRSRLTSNLSPSAPSDSSKPNFRPYSKPQSIPPSHGMAMNGLCLKHFKTASPRKVLENLFSTTSFFHAISPRYSSVLFVYYIISYSIISEHNMFYIVLSFIMSY